MRRKARRQADTPRPVLPLTVILDDFNELLVEPGVAFHEPPPPPSLWGHSASSIPTIPSELRRTASWAATAGLAAVVVVEAALATDEGRQLVQVLRLGVEVEVELCGGQRQCTKEGGLLAVGRGCGGAPTGRLTQASSAAIPSTAAAAVISVAVLVSSCCCCTGPPTQQVHLGEHVDVRQLEPHHGRQRKQHHRHELGRVPAVVHVGKVHRAELRAGEGESTSVVRPRGWPPNAARTDPKVEFLEALHNVEERSVVSVQLCLPRAVQEQVMTAQPVAGLLEPIKVLLKILKAKH